MLIFRFSMRLIVVLFLALFLIAETGTVSEAQVRMATTTVHISICGDTLVNDGEDCDVPGETGVYSTTIVGRQCNTECLYGPYCGDGILQTLNGEVGVAWSWHRER